jgi:hypothetical protein
MIFVAEEIIRRMRIAPLDVVEDAVGTKQQQQ